MTQPKTTEALPTDVFAAARWLEELWNSTARAVAPDLIEWQCKTWGSGHGGGDWLETAIFLLAKEAYNLDTTQNDEARDELIVFVPLDRFARLATVITLIGEEAEDWPWMTEEDEQQQLTIAADIIGTTVEALAENDDLLEALGLA